jgi:hypothetical protein
MARTSLRRRRARRRRTMMMRRRRSRSRSRRRREVLIAIRDGTSHANWKDKKTGWDKLEQYTKMEDFESCRGVQTKGGKLTKIDLTDCNLVRSFPAALAKLDTLVDTLLDTLVVLYLYGNDLQGFLPAHLGSRLAFLPSQPQEARRNL